VLGTKINTKREKEKHIQLETKEECLVMAALETTTILTRDKKNTSKKLARCSLP
jgi:hypothetical protein